MFFEAPAIFIAQPSIAEPSADEDVHGFMTGVGDGVIVLEARDRIEGRARGRVLRRAEAWKEALFLIRGMARRCGREIAERTFDLRALWRRQRSRGALRNRGEHREKVLDAAVAVAQQTQRLVESVVGLRADFDQHAVSVARAGPGGV